MIGFSFCRLCSSENEKDFVDEFRLVLYNKDCEEFVDDKEDSSSS